MNKNKYFSIIIILVFLFSSVNTEAQFWKKKKNKSNTALKAKPKKKSKKKTIKELTKSSKKIEGLFNVFQDTITGKLQMVVNKNQLDKEFIYFSQIADGSMLSRTNRGKYQGSNIFSINKYYERLEFIVPNISYYFDEKLAISKSAKANVSDATVVSAKILASDDKEGLFLIDADALFLTEVFTMIKYPQRKGMTGLRLGKLVKNKSRILEIKNYPVNTNIKTEYVYANTKSYASKTKTISVKVFHTFMNMPEEDYKTRYDDARVGYFIEQVEDMTSTSVTPFRDVIHRWKLIKKNPEKEISEPVKPITWYMENSTPLEFRDIIKEGVLAWNKAFEAAGFKNAMVVKIQPDDADWDAGDVRYNVLRWTSSPNPLFGGYGPSFVNPRTGEILGADIMLEYVYFTNRVKYDRVFNGIVHAKKETINKNENHLSCSMGHLMHKSNLFGKTVLVSSGASESELKEMQRESIKRLIMHEVGHTLGLNHNMKASQRFSPEELANAEIIKGQCLSGSVMDYPAINITNDRSKQGQYYDTNIGPYDVWAIQFGYTDFESNKEKITLLEKSTQPELVFGNDADDMRSPGKAIDPRVMVGDLSNDAITYSINRFKLVNNLMNKLKEKTLIQGKTYQELYQSFRTLENQSETAGTVLSRYIGGVYVDRATIGQQGATKPFTPVSLHDQKRAMEALKMYVFAPNAFAAPNNLYNYLAKQRRGFNFFRGTEDPKIHGYVLGNQLNVLNHLLHHYTFQRIVDSELYGNQYKLANYMTDLNDAIFKEDIYSNVNTFRQNLQTEYTKKLIGMLNGKMSRHYVSSAQAMALYNLKEIKKMASNNSGNILTKAHKMQLITIIDNALKEVK